MKAKVKIQFYDSVAKKVRKKGEVIDITPARFNEIRNKGAFIEAVNDEKPVKA
jgi:hypothetical protein